MKTRLLIGWFVLSFATFRVQSAPLGTAFTYQGRLSDSGAPADGVYDLRFALYDSDSGGSPVGNVVTNEDVTVTNGLFTTPIDFGATVFTNEARWLEIRVRPGNSTGDFTLLNPRQPLRPAPFAFYASGADTATTATIANGVAANAVGNAGIQNAAVTAPKIAGGQVVKSLNSWRDDVTLTAGANVALTPAGNGLQISAGPWQTAGANVYYDAGNVGIGTATPGEALHLEGGNLLMNAAGEREWRLRRTDLPNRPAFRLGRITTAGDGSPEFRALYSDDAVGERSVFEFDNKGIVASVKTNVGSHFEGFIAGDSEPLFRLNSFPAMQLELGAGGTNRTDAKIRRADPGAIAFVTGVAGNETERMRVHSNGNVGIGTNRPAAPLQVAGADQTVAILDGSHPAGTWLGIGNAAGGYRWSIISTGNGNAEGAGRLLFFTSQSNDTRMRLEPNGDLVIQGTISQASDRDRKENLQPIQPAAVLEKVAALPISTWNYRDDEARTRHVGPMAQDFHAAFGLGADDRHIATVDAEGLALVAIQGLNQKLEARLQRQETELQSLKKRVAALEKLVASLAEQSGVRAEAAVGLDRPGRPVAASGNRRRAEFPEEPIVQATGFSD